MRAASASVHHTLTARFARQRATAELRRQAGETPSRHPETMVGREKVESSFCRVLVYWLAAVCGSSLALAQTARVAFEDSVAVYGPEIFPALTRLHVCGKFRVLAAYVSGTDLLFVDEVAPSENGSTIRIANSFGFVEFNHYEASRSITDLACRERDAESLEISGSAHDGHESKDFRFNVLLDTRTGEYEYSDTLG